MANITKITFAESQQIENVCRFNNLYTKLYYFAITGDKDFDKHKNTILNMMAISRAEYVNTTQKLLRPYLPEKDTPWKLDFINRELKVED